MRHIFTFMVFCWLSLISACSVESASLALPESAIPVTGHQTPNSSLLDQDPVPQPPGDTCACGVPQCYGKPVLSGGLGGCTPTLGDDSIGSVDIRMPGGEILTVWQGGIPSMFLDAQPQNGWFLAHFAGVVEGRRFMEAAPLLMSGYIEVTDEMNTLLVNPQGAMSVVKLPPAIYHAGRIVRVKIVGPGTVDIKGSVNGWTGLVDPIEGSSAGYSMVPTPPHTMPSVELQAYYDDPTASLDVPHETGWAIVGSFP